MGQATSGGLTSPLATAATFGGNQVLDKGLQAAGVQGGLNGGLESLGRTIQGNGGLLGQEGAAPVMANIQQGTTVEDVRGAQTRTGNALNSQQALLQALQAQNGLGMQNTAAGNQLGLANQLQNANGVGVQQGAVSGLQNTAGMYQNIANGVGPNPAQAMLNQATGQNVANQAALMAGQRGAGANVGLMARQAAQQGAATQQQAVGQGATMQANQQLNALSGLSGTQQAIGGLGGSLTGQQMGANQAYANQANQVAGQQIGATNANTQANLANQQQAQQALQGINNSNVAAQGSVNAGNTDLSKANSAAKQQILGGAGQAIGAGIGLAKGGVVHMADGGFSPSGPMTPMVQPVGPQSSFGQYIASAPPIDNEKESEELVKDNDKKKSEFSGSSLEKGTAGLTSALGKRAMASKGGLAKTGGHVNAKEKAQKAVEGGNSYSNDKIPAMLSEGEIVLPRSVTQSKDPKGAAARFVAQVLARKKVTA